MTVNVSKPSINLREKISELDKPSGIAGEHILRSETPQEVFEYIGARNRNVIINGDMSVAQRGTTFSGMTLGQYTLDRWSSSTSGANLTMSQQSFTGTDIDNFNSKHYIRLTVNTANNNCGFLQYVEDVKRFLGKTITLSFKAKGTNPAGGIIETAISCYTGTGGSYTTENRQQYSVTSDWQTFSFTTTIQSASGLTINDADSVMYVYPVIQPAGDTSTTSWEVDVAEVQVEYGNIATPFEVVPYDVNLQRCKRYFERLHRDSSGDERVAVGWFNTTTDFNGLINYNEKRVNPTITINNVGSFRVNYLNSATTPSSASGNFIGKKTCNTSWVVSGMTAGQGGGVRTDLTTASIDVDAEL